MTSFDRRRLLAAGAVLLAAPARAQTFPARQIRFVCPYPPCGTTDFITRILAERLTETIGQRVLVENRAGAAGVLGMREVAASEPDGHTIVMTDTSISITPTLNPGAGLDPRAFAPVVLAATFPSVLVVHPSVPARTLPELIAHAKANPGKLNFGSGGIGTGPHLHGEMFKWRAGLDIVHVAYRGNAPALADLLGGQIQILFTGTPTAGSHIQAGSLRLVATTGSERLPAFRDTPTAIEQGLAEFVAEQWFGVLAPAATPAAVVARLNEMFAAALREPSIATRIAEQGGIPRGGSPQVFAAHIAREATAWADVIRAARITMQ
jgi:tripartite-type tricarboxylate transporter receptor subunit TctC